MFGVQENNISTYIIFFVVLILTYYFIGRRRRCSSLPPGPTPYPFVGNYLHFVGRNFWEVLRDYRKEYGNIYTVHIFDKIIIVISGHENIKDAFVKQASDFSERPFMKRELLKGSGVIMASGDIWKHNRRFTIHTLRDFGMGKNKLQCRIHEEISYFLDAIEEHRGQPFNIKDLLNIAVSNIICSIVFGKRFDYHDEDFLNYVRIIDELVASGNFSKPSWSRHIPGDPFQVGKLLRRIANLKTFYKRNIQEHLDDFDANNVQDLIGTYIKQMKESAAVDELSPMNEDELLRLIHDLFIAGTETTTTSLRFGLMFLLRHPDIQSRLSDDLQKVVPLNRLPDLSDKPDLTFVEATVFEIFRRSHIVHFSVPHAVKRDTEYKGYKIPTSAIVMPDLESVLMDDALWDDPETFNPSRFLDGNMSITKTENLIPFSVGPRVCLGEALAKMEMYLFLSAMLQRFKFLPPEGEGPPNLDVFYGSVCSPRPFKLRAIKK